MAIKKKGVRSKDSAIVINEKEEQFVIVSSQTVLSSCDKMISSSLDDKSAGSIRRASFNISMGDETIIERRKHFDGIQLLARESNKKFDYAKVETDIYDITGLSHPSPSVALFTGGYSSRDGCFIIGCNNKQRRVLYVGGVLDRGTTRIKLFGFPTTIAKALHNTCTAYPELMPPETVVATNEYGEVEEFPIYGEINTPITTYLAMAVSAEVFSNYEVKTGDFVSIKYELPKTPNGSCSQQFIAKI